jgi:hypothetical protein
MPEIQLRTVPRHCELPDCRKCRARFRWYRRKAWQARKSTSLKPREKESDAAMTVSMPLFVIVAVLVFIAYRYLGLRVWQAAACILLGFLLAATGAAPEINSLITGIVHWLTGARGGAR